MSTVKMSYPDNRFENSIIGKSTKEAHEKYGHVTIFDMEKDINKILETDCYNTSHEFLKENTDWEVSHIYARGRAETVIYLFSHIVADIFRDPITKDWIEEAEVICNKARIPFPRHLFERVVDELNGYVPLRICALPDGTIVPKGTPICQVENTVKGFGELVTWWEGVLLKGHYPIGAMTEVFQFYKYLVKSFELECKMRGIMSEEDKLNHWNFYKYRFHSFAFRSFNSKTDAVIVGTAWGMLMYGTDDLQILQLLPFADDLGSISATAHKTMQQFDDELNGFKKAIQEQANLADKNDRLGRVVALVIDTYNPDRVINEYLPVLAAYAAQRSMHIVLRPDSGAVINQAIAIWNMVQRLGKITNVSVIIGEGMSLEQAKKYDEILVANDVPLGFVFYGIGGGIHKHINRDFINFSMKTSFSNGESRCKFSADPIKASIAGKIDIFRNEKDDLVVDLEENVGFGEFVILYEFEEGYKKPYIKVFSIEDNYRLIRFEVDIQMNREPQQDIIKSQSVLDEVNRIASMHGLL